MNRTAVWLALSLVACTGGEPSVPPLRTVNFASPSDGGSSADGSVSLGSLDPSDVPDGACGSEDVQASQDPANVYFVLDRSASMAAEQNGVSRYRAVRDASVHLVETLGWRFRFGATLFPSVLSGGCDAGVEVFSSRDGDPKSYADAGTRGPVADQFARALLSDPQGQFAGATPTAATLAKLGPTLAALGKNTYVFLATDGAPNCNANVRCSRDRCIPNLESAGFCPSAANCCDPKDPHKPANTVWSWGNCLDDDASLTAVAALHAAGVKTLVLGVPGSEAYATLLDAMAVAGGAPRDASPRYYQVSDLSDLDHLFQTLGASVLVSCDVSLQAPSVHPELTNIYFDKSVVPQSEQDGWTWNGDQKLQIHGPACDRLLAGAVRKIRVFVGCPTLLR